MSEPDRIGWQVSPLHQDDLPRSVEVGDEGMSLGRAPDNTLVIDGAKHPEVSAHHARLVERDEVLVLEDLGSTHGVLVEGEKIERRVLRSGEVFELGPGGPRFVVHLKHDLAATAAVPAAVVPGRTAEGAEGRRVGDDTVQIVAARLGIEPGSDVEEMIEKRTRPIGLVAAVLLIVVAGGLYALLRTIRTTSRSLAERTAELESALEERLAQSTAAMEAQREAWSREQREKELAAEQWAQQRAELLAERERLAADLRRLEAGEKSAAGELAELKARLESTTETLSLFDPVILQQHRLEVVERIEDAVVMIEARQHLVDRATGRDLSYEVDEKGEVSFNFEGKGELFAQGVSGSGFCVSPEGYVVTNAHVVLKDAEGGGDESPLPSEFFDRRTVLEVVFSGTRERRPAEVVAWRRGEREDLALIRIEPFEGMPHLDGLDLDVPPPPRGTEVFVLGFPLGKQVLQEGDLVIASAFRGIVSRRVDYYLQIDAAIHPGASGGPVIDGDGRVLGIVTGVQALSEGTQSSAIGYIIPVGEARAIWPPAEKDG